MVKNFRRGKTTRNVLIGAVFVVTVAGYVMLREETPQTTETPEPQTNGIALLWMPNDNSAPPGEPVRADAEAHPTPPDPSPPQSQRGATLFQQGLTSLENQDLLNARAQLNEALKLGLPEEQARRARARLVALSDDLLFSPRRISGDPLVTYYVVRSGDNLREIAKDHLVTAELIGRVNQLKNINMIRVGQTLKIPRGPFHATVNKAAYEMTLYLQDTLVRHFPVGLGMDGSTPTGVWTVTSKLINPTYYSPIGEGIIEADDPANPLGERWIGLEGVSGDAVGQLRYGIHGTNDPATIGQSASLGCVRLHNDDVAWVFDMLVGSHSQVTIVER